MQHWCADILKAHSNDGKWSVCANVCKYTHTHTHHTDIYTYLRQREYERKNFKDKETSINIWKMKSSNWLFKNISSYNLNVNECPGATKEFISSEYLRSKDLGNIRSFGRWRRGKGAKCISSTGCESEFLHPLLTHSLYITNLYFLGKPVQVAAASQCL